MFKKIALYLGTGFIIVAAAHYARPQIVSVIGAVLTGIDAVASRLLPFPG